MPVANASSTPGATAASICAGCGRVGSAGPSLSATLRSVSFDYCSEPCREAHAELVAATAFLCSAPGCDLDAVADSPWCDAHLEAGVISHRAGGSRAA
jgi:hypothetical protein